MPKKKSSSSSGLGLPTLKCQPWVVSFHGSQSPTFSFTPHSPLPLLPSYIIIWKTGYSPRSRSPGMWDQVGFRKHYYEQSWWRWWNSSWAISNPKRWHCESAALNMLTNVKQVDTILENVSFHSNSKERQHQRMFKLPYSYTHFTR